MMPQSCLLATLRTRAHIHSSCRQDSFHLEDMQCSCTLKRGHKNLYTTSQLIHAH